MTTPLPSLNALRAFESVARHLHYPSAADELNVSPAAVKQLISKLESSLGVKLVERNGRGLVLTASGAAGTEQLTAAMNLLSSSVQKMKAQPQSTRIIVSVESSLAATWLVPTLADFRSHFEGVNVLIESSQEVVDLHRSDVDVAIRYGVTQDNSLVSHRLFEDIIFPVCSPSMLSENGLTDITELAHLPLIHWDISKMPWARETRKWFTWESWFKHTNANYTPTGEALYFNDYGMAVQAAIAGQGVVLASWPILQNVVNAGLLVQPFKEVLCTDIGYDIVTTPDAGAEVETFVSWIRKAAAKKPYRKPESAG